MRSEGAHDLPSTRALFFVLILLKVLVSHLPGLPEAAESVISELLSNIFNIITLRYSKTDIFVLVSWTLHYTKFWGCCSSPLRMGTTQCFFSVIVQLSIFVFNISAVSACAHGYDWLIPTGRLWQTSPQKRCLSLSGQRLECICVLEHTNHPVSTMWSHPASSLSWQTHGTLLQEP